MKNGSRSSDVQVVERFLAAERRRRPLTMLRLTTRDVRLSLPATMPLIGAREFHGRRQAARALAQIFWHARGSLKIEPLTLSTTPEGLVLCRARVTARRGRTRLAIAMTFRFELRGGRICSVDETVDDLDPWLRFWARGHQGR